MGKHDKPVQANSVKADSKKKPQQDPTGRYTKLKEVLGSGAFKTVFKAIDHQEGREVAWNVAKLDRYQEEEAQKMLAEIDILKNLDNEYIIILYDSWLDEERQQIIFVTELMTSGTLRQFVERVGHVSLKVIKNWCRKILAGLHYLHTRDPPIIHRDIKCDNIFINGNSGQLKIGDLGLATAKKSHCLSIIGTPEYMAPEYYDEQYTETVDIWAFGMCIIEMVTGEYPYSECQNPAQIFKKVSAGLLPNILSRIKDEELVEFISLCLAPADIRPTAQQLLDHPFLAAIAQDPVQEEKLKRPVELYEAGLQPTQVKPPTHPPIQSQPPTAPISVPFSSSSEGLLVSPREFVVTEGSEVEDPGGEFIVESITRKSQDEANPHILEFELSLIVDGEHKDIDFDFNLKEDTPASVAMEMTEALEFPDHAQPSICAVIEQQIANHEQDTASGSDLSDESESSDSYFQLDDHDDPKLYMRQASAPNLKKVMGELPVLERMTNSAEALPSPYDNLAPKHLLGSHLVLKGYSTDSITLGSETDEGDPSSVEEEELLLMIKKKHKEEKREMRRRQQEELERLRKQKKEGQKESPPKSVSPHREQVLSDPSTTPELSPACSPRRTRASTEVSRHRSPFARHISPSPRTQSPIPIRSISPFRKNPTSTSPTAISKVIKSTASHSEPSVLNLLPTRSSGNQPPLSGSDGEERLRSLPDNLRARNSSTPPPSNGFKPKKKTVDDRLAELTGRSLELFSIGCKTETRPKSKAPADSRSGSPQAQSTTSPTKEPPSSKGSTDPFSLPFTSTEAPKVSNTNQKKRGSYIGRQSHPLRVDASTVVLRNSDDGTSRPSVDSSLLDTSVVHEMEALLPTVEDGKKDPLGDLLSM